MTNKLGGQQKEPTNMCFRFRVAPPGEKWTETQKLTASHTIQSVQL
jgi:hypothetical protein